MNEINTKQKSFISKNNLLRNIVIGITLIAGIALLTFNLFLSEKPKNEFEKNETQEEVSGEFDTSKNKFNKDVKLGQITWEILNAENLVNTQSFDNGENNGIILDEGKRILQVKISILNSSEKTVEFSKEDLKVVDYDGNSYLPEVDKKYYLEENIDFTKKTIPQNGSIIFSAIYIAPTSASGFFLEVSNLKTSSSLKKVKISLGF
jgi:FtsZ-interacting cell division protein ZipA